MSIEYCVQKKSLSGLVLAEVLGFRRVFAAGNRDVEIRRKVVLGQMLFDGNYGITVDGYGEVPRERSLFVGSVSIGDIEFDVAGAFGIEGEVKGVFLEEIMFVFDDHVASMKFPNHMGQGEEIQKDEEQNEG
ncbi:MAG: hypothetical protein UW64_C0023G0013 [Microgenomates group bacterium GW2011_GWC1_44_37]|uniref:Uncharacterized protein n=1 Tax=Candidatus Collierbacteria bacterium GW2011_GWB2_44_22 TaxID=1618387 RepID=A0A0G1HXB6_9BACT|nr:MAG: hypothetical protein UW44_C0008G0083 [Candidatus Collierbacteria bacterium GW2011_GWB2_44_22]KKT68297.1 MAG: hypothetical protein UW64_C0023G0013 [Microgenomates group bacterium GW2011_GWC1_44_37]